MPRPTHPAAATVPSPMPETAAAWVRRHAWTDRMRHLHAEGPAGWRWIVGSWNYATSPCQQGPCGSCDTGLHGLCATRYRTLKPSLTVRDPKPVSVLGSRGRVAEFLPPCRGWTCPCPCRTGHLQLDLFSRP